ncbi:carboxylate-amine ligase [Actinoplanes sp. CA-030573]|uniref:carboxylate-amine ligase n=1 Tax=Actinoplanes sp. CA-030573 TaxID=3239898 RepID=UPI003D908527
MGNHRWPEAPTVGVEEEFLLIDPGTGENVAVADRVLTALPDEARAQSRPEFRRSMIEMVTPVCSGLSEVRDTLIRLRREAGRAAQSIGARLVAIGATPVAEPTRTVPDDPRYQHMVRRYGPIAEDPACCGCHVHVGVPDRELAVQICNHLRVWLPMIQAMTVNSPYWEGADTGYGSWRCAQLERWPSMGPTPLFADAAEYDATVDEMITSGTVLDRHMVYWYARPSDAYPTVEVRVADVCPTVDDVLLLAGLIRALVVTAADDVRAGVRARQVRDCLLSAAHWHAAHDSLDGTLVHPGRSGARPAWDVISDLVAAVTPALHRLGDDRLVHDQLDRLRRQGTGAARQRRVRRDGGDLGTVLTAMAAQTVGD